MSPQVENKRIDTIDALRGLASLAVCWFHLTNGNSDFLPNGLLKSSGAHGWLGVEIFFVISGFIIPYALWRSSYRISDYARFVFKRIIRLDPPYLISIILIIILTNLAFLVPGFKGAMPDYSLAQILLHLGYVNVFFGYDWVNPVYWTLAIEFQYYLLIAVSFPLLKSPKSLTRYGTMAVLGSLAFALPHEKFIFHWLFLFLVGILTFHYKVKLIGKIPFITILGLISYGVWLTLGAEIACLGLITALAIAFVSFKNAIMKFFGDISYSLYLLHVPIGGKLINLSTRYFFTLSGKVFSLSLALTASIVAAYLLYRLIEKPAQNWSSSITYSQ